jgi:hypothetical protein
MGSVFRRLPRPIWAPRNPILRCLTCRKPGGAFTRGSLCSGPNKAKLPRLPAAARVPIGERDAHVAVQVLRGQAGGRLAKEAPRPRSLNANPKRSAKNPTRWSTVMVEEPSDHPSVSQMKLSAEALSFG